MAFPRRPGTSLSIVAGNADTQCSLVVQNFYNHHRSSPILIVIYTCIGASDKIFDHCLFRSSAPTSPAPVSLRSQAYVGTTN